MRDKYINPEGLRAIKLYVDEKVPTIQEQGNWLYRIYEDDTFEAWYKASKQTIVINNASGNLYRSNLISLELPSDISTNYSIAIQHAEINASHNNYPCWGMLASISNTGINYYAMSGGSRSSSPNYIVTAYVFGKLSAQ